MQFDLSNTQIEVIEKLLSDCWDKSIIDDKLVASRRLENHQIEVQARQISLMKKSQCKLYLENSRLKREIERLNERLSHMERKHT